MVERSCGEQSSFISLYFSVNRRSLSVRGYTGYLGASMIINYGNRYIVSYRVLVEDEIDVRMVLDRGLTVLIEVMARLRCSGKVSNFTENDRVNKILSIMVLILYVAG